MRYLVIGSGGREHAISWRLLNDGSATEVFVAPGNGGIEEEYRVDVQVDDFDGILKVCMDKEIDMVVVGPEAPLADGLVDFLEEKGLKVFGPQREAAQLEGSKLFAKMIMEKYGVPTGYHKDFVGKKDLIEFIETIKKYPIVIKLDGLAAGKGVGIPENKSDALKFIDEMVEVDSKVFIEEFLEGEEASVLGISDGKTILSFISAQDHKRIYEGDRGPNTGGMGAYGPAPVMTSERLKEVHEKVLQPTVDGMTKEGTPFKGILYAGIIVTEKGIKVLEYNVRFGDPEVQVILPLLENKLGEVFSASVNGTLDKVDLKFKDKHAVTVVMSSGGYPGSYEKGKTIQGIETVSNDIIVFHAGTIEEKGTIKTNGGRVLNVTTMGDTLEHACNKVYKEIEKISFEGAYYRTDIAHRALNR
jgi:phosphoribosylamine--glycine ligase